MSEPSNAADFRQSLVAAVQAELQRHAASLGAEIERLRKESADERDQLRREIQGQIGDLARIVAQVQAQSEADLERLSTNVEARVADSEARQVRRLEDMTSGLSATVQAAARPILADVAADHERANARLDALDAQLRKFDEQAARMVTYVNDVIQKTERRQAELVTEVHEKVAADISTLRPLVDEIDSSVRRFQSEISSQTSNRINDAEDRFNTRLMAAEARMKEAAGTQIAEIQAHVGRVSAHLDDTLAVLNNRHEQVAEQFLATDRKIEELAESVRGVDSRALDEMANKVSNAVGEAMLVRIEMERLEKAVNERTDELIVRVTEVETQLIDATMDVSTAIQLDRLEELERAVLELDPSRFVAYDPSGAGLKRKTDETEAAADGAADDASPAEAVAAEPSAEEPAVDAADDAEPDEPGDSAATNNEPAVSDAAGTEPASDGDAPPVPVMAPPPSAGPISVAPPPPMLAPRVDPEDSLNGSSAVAEELPVPASTPFVPPAG